ncbi:hypothetical protein HOY82DRAFT_550717 [Tuber indicum]|nr:hypothetical protein HOY82DRAFT_550717 [Tuber indicum]
MLTRPFPILVVLYIIIPVLQSTILWRFHKQGVSVSEVIQVFGIILVPAASHPQISMIP